MEKQDTRELCSKAKFYEAYARFDEEKGHYETWENAVQRVMNMHREKYQDILTPELEEYIQQVETDYKNQLFLGSQRNLQFGGEQTLKKPIKSYNCSSSFLDRPEFFGEYFYALLGGVGVGFSVQKKHIQNLPKIKSRTNRVVNYTIPDSIEGWADSIDVLMSSFFEGGGKYPQYQGKKIYFDFNEIRPKGSYISGGFKAPGPEPLRASLIEIEKLLDKVIEEENGELRSIHCYDLCMFLAEAVLAGGVRRAATSVIFDPDDEEMLNAKVGNWLVENPQRSRSNNSAILYKEEITKEQIEWFTERIKEYGEPGYVLTDDPEKNVMYNPCIRSSAPMIKPNSMVQMKDVEEGDYIWSKEGWTKVIAKWCSGVKDVYRYRTTAGVFYGTSNHQIVQNGDKIEVGDAQSIDSLTGNKPNYEIIHDPQIVMDGLIVGDSTQKQNHCHLYIGENDYDYFNSEISDLIHKEYGNMLYKVQTTIQPSELPKTYKRSIPERFKYADQNTIASFLRGLYSTNGSVVYGKTTPRVTLKTSSKQICEDVQLMLSALGIHSYCTTNKKRYTEFSNGEYECRESYDINVLDISSFKKTIGFIQQHKMDELPDDKVYRPRKKTFDIVDVEYISTEPVYDITVDNESHTFWTGGCDVSNCFEIGMFPQTEDGRSGFQMCNLVEINGGACVNEEKFYRACESAAIMGTLQAGYTDFNFFSSATKEITERESLLGVSITGWMNNPNVLFDENVLEKGVNIIKNINDKVSSMIGINPAARLTTTKPAGNSCCGIDSSIKTENGIMNMKEIFQYCSNIDLENRYWHFSNDVAIDVENELNVYDEFNALKPITGLYINGISEVYEIEFEDGNVYKFTENHKLKTHNGWKTVKELTENDEIVGF